MVDTRARRRHHAVRHRRHVRRRRVRDHPRARRCAAVAIRSCWPPRWATRWAAICSAAACRGGGSCRRATTACAGCRSTTSTCTRCTGPTPSTPIDETLAAFDELVTSGKVRRDRHVDVLAGADRPDQRPSRRAGCRPPDQRAAAVLGAGPGHRDARCCRRVAVTTLGVIVWAPLNGGWLTGKYQGAVDDAASRALRQPDHFDHGKEAIRAAEARHWSTS